MPKGWRWDETLFRGSAAYYERGRLPYPPGIADALAVALRLDRRGCLIDVGCGPGTVALRLAHLFESVVGLDADADMLIEADRRTVETGASNARWVRALAEDLPVGLGMFRVATFAQSFHWMDRDRVVAAVFEILEPGGVFVQVTMAGGDDEQARLPHPGRPRAAIDNLIVRYLGPVRRAGQGLLRHGTPGGEDEVVTRGGFGRIEVVRVPGGEVLARTIDDIVAAQFSNSGSAPHLFGDRLGTFERELRALLVEASPSSLFSERTGETELRLWQKP